MADKKLTTASVLAFERKLDPSDGLFYATDWQQRHETSQWRPVGIQEKSVRGTISNRLKRAEQDPAKLDAAIDNPNLQTVDVSALPADLDTLAVRFTLRVLGGAGTPWACNNVAYEEKLLGAVDKYLKDQGFGTLAKRYAYNIANGRFLWRNRIGAENVEVNVKRVQQGERTQVGTFDAFSLSLRGFEPEGNASQELNPLSELIEDGLSGNGHVLLEVDAFARAGRGQEVFPSQELVTNRERGSKSKTLYDVDGVAAIHSQKIGNALRTIDTWYPGEEDLGPISVEPYGSVTTRGTAYRQPKDKADFYSLLDNWILKDKVPRVEDQHFVMATLIRGGVFGE